MTRLTDPRIFDRAWKCSACGKPPQRGDEPSAAECSCYGELVEDNTRRWLPEADTVRDIHLARIPGTERDAGGAVADIPQRFVYHSPDGFEWGYGGSGPADLALNILALFVPPPEAWRLHQDYKWQIIARLDRQGPHTIGGRRRPRLDHLAVEQGRSMTAAVPVPDDSAVPRIQHTKGWAVRRTQLGAQIFTRPDGVEFVEAHHLERADLIREFADPGLTPVRLVRWDGSAAARAEERTRQLAAGKTRRQQARKHA